MGAGRVWGRRGGRLSFEVVLGLAPGPFGDHAVIREEATMVRRRVRGNWNLIRSSIYLVTVIVTGFDLTVPLPNSRGISRLTRIVYLPGWLRSYSSVTTATSVRVSPGFTE